MPARLEISLDNLKSNVLNIKKYINENSNANNVELLAMVKADAYGAGIVKVSKVLESLNIKYLGVAYLKEAKILRENGIKANIVVFSGILLEDLEEAVNLDVAYAASNIDTLIALNDVAKSHGKKVKIHIAIDTGMGRIGVLPKDILSFAEKLKKLENIEVEGVFSHFSSADTDTIYTKKQNDIFNECLKELQEAGIKYTFVHICNSIGITNFSNSYNNMVRLGIGMYGYLDKEILKEKNVSLKGIFKLSVPICDIRKIDARRSNWIFSNLCYR